MQWRDIEFLAASPATFQALKQLPELQQLIAFTAPDVVSGQPFAQQFLVAVGSAYEQTVVSSHSNAGRSLGELLEAASDTNQHSQAWARLVNGEASLGVALAPVLSPHLRLALAAEVAAGILCPG